MTNPRDVTLDIVGRDQTEKATRSAANNFDKLARKVDEVDDTNKNLGSRGSRYLRKLSDAVRGVASKMDGLKRKTEDGTLAVRSMGSKTAGSLRKLSRALDEAGDEADQLKRKVDDIDKANEKVGKRAPGHLRQMTNAMIRSAKIISSVGPLAMVGLIAVAIANLPLIATVAGEGIVAGLGGGLAALGIKFAAHNAKVKKSFTDLKTHVVKKMEEISAAFVPVLQNISSDLQGAFDSFAPDLKKAFDRIAPVVRRFSKAVTESLDLLKPALVPIVDGFETLADSVSAGMPSLLQDIATAFTDIADAIGDNPQSIKDTVVGLGSIIKACGKVIAWLIRVNAHIEATEATFDVLGNRATVAMGKITVAVANMAADVLESIARIPGPGQAAFRLLAAAARTHAAATQRHLDKINVQAAKAEVRGLETRLTVLGNMKPTPEVTAEIRDLKIKLDTARALLAKLDGKTATVTVNYRSRAFRTAAGTFVPPNLSGGVGFARTSPGGSYRTGGPAMAGPTVNATTYVTLDGREIAAHVRTIISEATGRQAFRARSGRR